MASDHSESEAVTNARRTTTPPNPAPSSPPFPALTATRFERFNVRTSEQSITTKNSATTPKTSGAQQELADRDVDVLAPVPDGEVLEGRVGKRDFAIDPAAGTVTCPAGHTAQITTSKKGVRTARISRAACRTCPLKERCCPGRESRQIALGEHEELIVTARQALADPDTAAHLRHTRPRIERLLGLLACQYGARKSRYIGTKKATLQASWAAALVNLNPIGRRLATGAS